MHLRGREGCFQQLLVPSFPLAPWGCLEGSTSHFPLRPVPTTKPPSRSLTRSENVPSWVLTPRAGGSSPPGETAVLTLRLGGGGKTPGGLRLCRGGWMRGTRRHRACPVHYRTCSSSARAFNAFSPVSSARCLAGSSCPQPERSARLGREAEKSPRDRSAQDTERIKIWSTEVLKCQRKHEGSPGGARGEARSGLNNRLGDLDKENLC